MHRLHTLRHNRDHVVSFVTVANRVESPDHQLQESHHHRNSTRRVEHGIRQRELDLCGSGSGGGRWNSESRQRRWRITVAVQQCNGNHGSERDCWLRDQCVQAEHHRRQRMTAHVHAHIWGHKHFTQAALIRQCLGKHTGSLSAVWFPLNTGSFLIQGIESVRRNGRLHHYSIWTGHAPDLWLLTVKNFSRIPTHLTTTCGNFHWNSSTVYGNITSHETDIKGLTMDGQTTVGHWTESQMTAKSIMPLPNIVGKDIKICNLRWEVHHYITNV